MADLGKLLLSLGITDTSRTRYVTHCPAHKDRSPSLLIKVQDTGKITVNCYAGCTASAILMKLGLGFDVLYLNNKGFTKVNPQKYLDEMIVQIARFDRQNKRIPHQSDADMLAQAKKRITFYRQRY